MNRMSRTFWELALNCFVLGVIIQIVCIFLPYDLLQLSIGLWLGVAVAVAAAVSMEISIMRSMDMAEKTLIHYMRARSVLRYVFIVLVFGLILVYGIGNPLACFAGIMTLKVGAYLQPFTHKILKK